MAGMGYEVIQLGFDTDSPKKAFVLYRITEPQK
jgi:hypothetical protein